MSLSCLENIVGLSPTACSCYDASKPVDFPALNASSSGLYVMDASTITVRFTNSAADCENGGPWDLALQARTKAVRELVADFLTNVQKSRQEQFLPFSSIGDRYYASGELVQDNVAATWIEPYRIRGAKLNIESIDIAFFSGIVGATPVTIEIYSSLDFTTPLASAVANVTTNKTFFSAVLASTLTIDLGAIRDDLNERIYFVYTIPVGATPVKNNTKINACCNSSSNFKDNPYLQVLNIGGVQASSISNLATPPIFGTSTMQGMDIKASLYCDYLTWLCNLAQKPDALISTGGGQRLRLGMALADAIQAKSVINLIDSIILSGRINIFTMVLDTKQLKAIQAKAWPIYYRGIKNLSYYMPADISDCLICSKNKLITKSSILV